MPIERRAAAPPEGAGTATEPGGVTPPECGAPEGTSPASPQAPAASEPRPSGFARAHPLVVAAVVTIAVTVASYAAPADYAATAVGAVFLAAITVLVLRRDTATIRHFGLSLGGLLEPSTIDWRRAAREAARAAAWAGALAAIVTVPFAIGFRIYWHARAPFVLRWPASILDEVFGQVLVIALPEEGFYRGYLLTALDDLWGTPWTLFKAKVGWGWLVSSAVFAVGHFFTEPDPQRLAVFFPALVFGWLRARTGGVGAPALFHVLCNLLASTLSRGYGFGMR